MTRPVRNRLPKYCVEDKDRYGNVRVYLRRKGRRKVLLTGVPWSQDFMTQYEAALKGSAEGAAKGTFKWLCERYFESPEFKKLDDRNRPNRKNLLDKICAEPISPSSDRLVGNFPVAQFPPKMVRALRDRISHTPEAANSRVKAMRVVFSVGIENEDCENNPARDVPYLESDNPDGFHTWTIEEVERYEKRHPIGTKAHLAMALLLYTGQRRSDGILLGKQHVKNGWLKFTQFKNRRRKPIQMEIPIIPKLQEVIDAGPCGDLTFLVTEFGKPFSVDGFGNWFRERCIEAGVPGRAHGLRKAAAARLAELGASEKEIQAITGHRTSKEIERYTRKARQRILAGNAAERLQKI